MNLPSYRLAQTLGSAHYQRVLYRPELSIIPLALAWLDTDVLLWICSAVQVAAEDLGGDVRPFPQGEDTFKVLYENLLNPLHNNQDKNSCAL